VPARRQASRVARLYPSVLGHVEKASTGHVDKASTSNLTQMPCLHVKKHACRQGGGEYELER